MHNASGIERGSALIVMTTSLLHCRAAEVGGAGLGLLMGGAILSVHILSCLYIVWQHGATWQPRLHARYAATARH